MRTPLWQTLIWLVMFLLVVEGAIRKWILPGWQNELYLLKDAILIVAYLGFLNSHVPAGIHSPVMSPLKIILGASLVYFLFEIANPNSPSLLLSVVGFKNYLLYPPLAFIVPYMFSSAEDFERKLSRYAVIMIPFAALGLVQFAFGPEHWLNGYLDHDNENLRIGSFFGDTEFTKTRTAGTFSYVGGYATFLPVMFYLGASLTASKRWTLSDCYWALILIAVSIAAIFTTGSRGPIYGLVLFAPLMLIVWGYGGLMSMRTIAAMGFACLIIYIVVISVMPAAIEAYQYRAQHADDPMERIRWSITENFHAIADAGVLGTGMATTNGAAAAIMGTQDYWWLNGTEYVENEPARVLLETGLIGFVLMFAPRVWLLTRAIRLGMKFRTPLYTAVSGGLAGLFGQNLYGILINNPTGGIYYWFAAGLLFAMYRLEVEKVAASEASQARVEGRMTVLPNPQ